MATLGVETIQSNIQCSMCSSPTSQYCPSCKGISYCSKTCEKADLRLHKLICGQGVPVPANNYPGNRSNPSYHAVLFPADGEAPRFQRFDGMKHYNKKSYDYSTHQSVDHSLYTAQQFLGCKSGCTLSITGNVLRLRSRSTTKIELYYNDKSPTNKAGLNRSIVATTNGHTAKHWYGSLLALKIDTSSNMYLDMNMTDIRDVVDLLCTYPATNISDMTNIPAAVSPKVEVSVVRINCPGDHALGRPKFETIKIRANHVAYDAPVTSISQLMDFPLRVIRCSAPYASEYEKREHNVDNTAATYLNMGVDPEVSWGFVGLDWVDPAGSVIVVRGKGQNLSPQHVEAMCHWCEFVLRPLFDNSRSMGLHPETPIAKSAVLARITRSEFEDFYVGYDAWKGRIDPSWKKSQGPFC